jgi:hypothetical protein
MIIDYQRSGKCLWHRDCINHFGGIMKVVNHEADRSLLECLHCGKRGFYPVGGIGEVSVEEVTTEQGEPK